MSLHPIFNPLPTMGQQAGGSTLKLTAPWDLTNLPPDADPAYCAGMNVGLLIAQQMLKGQGVDVEFLDGYRQEYDGWWKMEKRGSV